MPYEEIDHHADVMLHVWGESFETLLSDAVEAMSSVFLGYSTEKANTSSKTCTLKMKFLQTHRLLTAWKRWVMGSNPTKTARSGSMKGLFDYDFIVKSCSEKHLLYQVLDEYLFLISTENICCIGSNFELAYNEIGTHTLIELKCCLKNVRINVNDVSAGIEIKAVTKHNLRVTPSLAGSKEKKNSRWDAWFVLDV